ncbi:MAG: phenylacetic acid degradation protein PaaY [Proteobacteria bacterium]|nr:phenylacetic acid degradation protein PaaY [Pseudomonadota bacterium]
MGIYEFEGKRPRIDEAAYVHPEAVVLGSVTIGKKCYIGPGAVLRADFGDIFVGDGSNIQENCVLHASHVQPIVIEENVIVAHGVLLHDNIVKRGAFIGMGAVLLHGAVVEEEAVVAAGSMVAHNYVVPRRKIVAGNPARVVKAVSEEMVEATRLGLAAYQELPERYRKGCIRIDV